MQGFITRIAPSPTGDMHLGTARTAYFNWLAARASGGRFILRIDDTDTERNKDECTRVILETMDWLGLDYDQLEYQSKRTELYQAELKLLMETTPHRLEILDNGALALKWHDWMARKWEDALAGAIHITDTNIEQIDKRLILARGGDKLGQVTYQFATVVDDWHMGVNHIIRGVDHITNTAKQVAIWEAINSVGERHGKVLPLFTHLGLITKDKKKLSKRDGAASMLKYKEAGVNPAALLNFMLRMGWGPKEDNKANSIIDKEKAVKMFLTEGRMRASPAGFDQAKLDWFIKVYK